MAAKADSASPKDQTAGIDAVVEPIKAVGGLGGFAIGFYVSYRSGADLTEAALHGLLGAGLMLVIAWYFALWLVRELMLQHVVEQRRLYTERVDEIRARGGKVREVRTPEIVPQAMLGPPE